MATYIDELILLEWIAKHPWCCPLDLARVYPSGVGEQAVAWARRKLADFHRRRLVLRRRNPDDTRGWQYVIGHADSPESVPATGENSPSKTPCTNCHDRDGVLDTLSTISEIEHWVGTARGFMAQAQAMGRANRPAVVSELAQRASTAMVTASGLLDQWVHRDAGRRNPPPESP